MSWEIRRKGKMMAELFFDIMKTASKDADFKAVEEKDIEKFNPFHDALGRFSTGPNAVSFTYKPGASKAHNRAIAREVVRTGKLGSGVRMVGTRVDDAAEGTDVYENHRKNAKKIGDAQRQYTRTHHLSQAGEPVESARERKNRLKRVRRQNKKTGTTATTRQAGRKYDDSWKRNNQVYDILRGGNSRPKKKRTK